MNKKNKIVFWVIIIVGILVRIYNFPNLLSEMNSDEIMTAVNAESIIETGKDIGGISFPVYLQGWGGQSVVLLYFMAFLMKLLGSSLFTVRLPMLIISIIGLFVIFDLSKKLTNNENIALTVLALTAISPWHMLQSIWSLDCNMFPHFLIIALDIFYTGILNKSKKIIYLSMIFFALTLYCYGVAIYFVPVFLVIMAIYLLRKKEVKILDIIICAIIFTIFALPIVSMFAINVLNIKQSIYIGPITIPYYENLSRTKDMLFFSPNKVEQLFKNIKSVFDMIAFQYDGGDWNASKFFGTIYHVSIAFAIFGIAKLIKNKKEPSSMVLLTWLIISLLTGFVINEANVNRLNSIWYLLIILTVIGIFEIYNKVKYKRYYVVVICVIYLLLVISYITYFYTNYNNVVDTSGCFSRGFYQSLSYVKLQDEKKIYYDNIKNDGCLELYIRFNKDESKEYIEIKDEQELRDKIKNVAEDEIVIVDVEFKQYEGTDGQYKIDDFVVVKSN